MRGGESFALPLDSLVAATGRNPEEVKRAARELKDAQVFTVWGSRWFLARDTRHWLVPANSAWGPGATKGEGMSPVQRVRCRKGFASKLEQVATQEPVPAPQGSPPRIPDLEHDEPDPGKHELSEEDALELFHMIGERVGGTRDAWRVARQWWDRQRQFPATLWRVGIEQVLTKYPERRDVQSIEYEARRVSRGGKLATTKHETDGMTVEDFASGLRRK